MRLMNPDPMSALKIKMPCLHAVARQLIFTSIDSCHACALEEVFMDYCSCSRLSHLSPGTAPALPGPETCAMFH